MARRSTEKNRSGGEAAAKPSAKPRASGGRKRTRKALMLVGGPWHQTDQAGEIASRVLDRGPGKWTLDVTEDLDALASLPTSRYSVVILHTTGHREALTEAREKGLLEFVEGGGGLVGVHSAADSFRGSRPYIEMLNAEFRTHPRFQELDVHIADPDHYLTVRMPDFRIEDELYLLQGHDPDRGRLLADTVWQGRRVPLAFVHPHGQGRVAYLALGHDLRAWRHPEFQKLLGRACEWAAGAELHTDREIRCGLLGYGPAHNMGLRHAEWMSEWPGMRTVAVSDIDPARLEAARADLPDARRFDSLDEMLEMPEVDLVVVILPHHLHAEAALKALRAGKHVVLEKPFCLTTQEATKMVRAARRSRVMLSVFHNRRWDGDYRALRGLVDRGLVGEVFHVEAFMGSYRRPGPSWRSDKMVSGGALYDWGAHLTDWILRLYDKRVTQVTGLFHKRWWQHVTNEDQAEAVMRFEGGEVADLQMSSLAAVGKDRWRVLGTLGGIRSTPGQAYHVTSFASGVRFDGEVPYQPSFSGAPYYRNVADHLLMGEALEVTPEQAREVIAVIETAERSSAEGRSLPLPPEVYEGR